MPVSSQTKLCEVRVLLNKNIVTGYFRNRSIQRRKSILDLDKGIKKVDNIIRNSDTLNEKNQEENILKNSLQVQILDGTVKIDISDESISMKKEFKSEVLLSEYNNTEVTREVDQNHISPVGSSSHSLEYNNVDSSNDENVEMEFVDEKPLSKSNKVFLKNLILTHNNEILKFQSGLELEVLNKIPRIVNNIDRIENINAIKDKLSIPTLKKTAVIEDMMKMHCIECKITINTTRGNHNQYLRNCPKCSTKMHFRCSKCGKLAPRRDTMRIHLKAVCYREQYYECSVCDFNAGTKSGLLLHMCREHPGAAHIFSEKAVIDDTTMMHCKKCNENLDLRNEKSDGLNRTCPKCHAKMYFRCSKCEKYFVNIHYIWNHLIEHCYPLQFYKCDNCDFKTTRKSTLSHHLQRNHFRKLKVDDYMWKLHCTKCNKNAKKSSGEINKCLRMCTTCNNKMHFQCMKCGKLLLLKRSIRNHLITVCYFKRLYKCDGCDSEMNTNSSLRRHMRRKHPEVSEICRKEDNGTFSCTICKIKFHQKCIAESHILKKHRITNKKTVSCSKCGKIFGDEYRMDEHSLTCGLRLYKCDFCSKSWSDPRYIKAHIDRYHSREIKTNNVDDICDRICNQGKEAEVAARKIFYAKQIVSGF